VTRKPDPAAERLDGVKKLVNRLGGSRLCFGEPIRVGERTVIPVGRVRVAGGGGFGSGDNAGEPAGGGGGGGWLDATPIGFIDAGPEGARFEAIPDPDATVRRIRGAATAAATLMSAVAGVRALRSARRQRLLGR
jgi:uncharacterized spore protein YtfJ